jgi:hypothetical protein
MRNWLLDGKKMSTERREEALSAYIDGELTPRERADLEGALARDPALRAELEEMRQVVGMMKAVPQVRLPRSFTLDPAVYGRTRQPWLRLYPALRTATVLATLVFVFLFAGNLLVNLSGTAAVPAEEPQMAAMRAAETTVVESEKAVEVTREVEAPAPKVASSAAPEESAEEAGVPVAQEEAPAPPADTESQGEGVARVMGTEEAAESAEPVEPPVAAPAGEEAAGEESPEPTGEPPMLMAVPPTAAAEGGGEGDSSVAAQDTATPAPESTVKAYGLEASQPTPEAAPEMAEEEVAPRGAEETSGGINWVLIAEIGLGALAAILLVLTLLARHYSW